MKSGLLRKTLAVVLMLQILLGTVPVQVFADDGDVPDEVTSAQSLSEEQPAEGSVSDGEDNGDREADITLEVSPEQPTENTQADNTGAGEEANSQENGNSPDAAPLLGAGNTCPAGDYVLGFQMYGNDATTDYYEEHIRILDSEGEQIGSVLTFNAFNDTDDRWDRKTISLTLDREPATIEVNVSYGPIDDPGPIQLHYTAPFETDYVGKDASAIRADNGEEVTFCHYDIQCVNYGTPIWYVDQYGNTHVKTDYETPGLDDQVGKEYWLPIRNSGGTQVLVVTGDTNIVLYDDVSYDCTGIFISPNSSLTIWGQKNGTGKLKTTGQTPGSETVLEQYPGDPGIEVWDDATLVINGGTIVAKGGKDAAGIGSAGDRLSGSITINGGHVTATGGEMVGSLVPDLASRNSAAGIGGGGNGSNGPIVITGGTVIAEAGAPGLGGAGIGSGSRAASGPITISGGYVNATGKNRGAGIGSGAKAGSGPIVISGGIVEASSYAGAGIGSGGREYNDDSNPNGPITITGGDVRAWSGDQDPNSKFYGSGAGIGAGNGGPQVGDITITGGEVTAVCTRRSAGIGGSANDNDGFAGGNITIDGQYTIVKALSVGGAGIGSGGRNVGANSLGANGASGGNITINNGNVTAVSTGAGAGIGGGNGGEGGTITINGGYVKAYGGNSKYKWNDESSSEQGGSGIAGFNDVMDDIMMGEFFDQLADVIIGALFDDTFAGSGIGGGSHAKGGNVVVNGGIVESTAGTNEAKAIGHGRSNSDNGSLSVYDNSKVTYGNYGNYQGSVIAVDGVDTSDIRHTYAQNNSYAKIEPGEITVTFNMNGHGTAPEDQIVTRGETAVRPDDPAETGYFFAGWYKDDQFTELYDFDEPVLTSTTLYAKWVIGYDLKIIKNWGGYEAAGPVTVNYEVEYAEGLSTSGTVTLNQGNAYSGDILISDESIVHLKEGSVEGFRHGDYTLGTDTVLPIDETDTAVLNLRDRADSGLTERQYNAAINLVRSGNAAITLENVKTGRYSVVKIWDIPEDQSYAKPNSIQVALQHYSEGTWTTVETLELKGNINSNRWTGEFQPVDDGETPFENYRIRELDMDGNIVLAADDADATEQDTQTVKFHITPDGDTFEEERDINYKVSYSDDVSNGTTEITNTNKTDYSVKVVWNDFPGEEGLPESVTVQLQGHQPADLVLTAENGWQGTFETRTDEAGYRVIEFGKCHDGVGLSNKHIFDDPNKNEDIADFEITKNGSTVIYRFTVTREYDPETRVTTITHTKTGVFLQVTKKWETDRDYSNPGIFIVFQHRQNDGNGNYTWANMTEATDSQFIELPNNNSYTYIYPAPVPLDENFSRDDYRVREWIDHRTDLIENIYWWQDFTTLTSEEGLSLRPTSDVKGRIMYLEEDDGYVEGLDPVFEVNYMVSSAIPIQRKKVLFRTLYETDEFGNYVIINREEGYLEVNKNWESETDHLLKPDSIEVALQHRTENGWETVETAELNESGSWKHSFSALRYCESGEFSADDFRIRELGSDGKVVTVPGDSDYNAADGDDTAVKVKYEVAVNGKETEVSYKVKYELKNSVTVITNTDESRYLTIEKKWDIDIEGKDHPESIEVVLQKKNGDSWENVEVVKLDSECEWRQDIRMPNGTTEDTEFRVRELKPESALDAFKKDLKAKIISGATVSFEDTISSLKTLEDGKYWDLLPDSVKEAAESGEENLKEELGAETGKLWDRLMDTIGLATAKSRIVYDKDDSDKGEGTTNEVTYKVDGYDSVVTGEEESAHDTKYSVSYTKDGNTYKITNKAILNIDIVKKWYSWGVEDDDMPESAWLVLMCKPSEGALDNAKDLASAAGVDLSGVLSYEFPVINPIKGGIDPIDLISQLTIGVNVSLFKDLKIIPTLAIAKAEKADESDDDGDEDAKDWRVEFTVSKYNMGIPMEYKGAELSSEVIRQIIKYISGFDLPVSFNPFDLYISVPGKAKGSTENFSLSDFDFSKLAETGKQFTQGDLDLMKLKELFESDTDLLASVMNLKIDWDTDDSDKIEGSKTWVNDVEAHRPEWIKIHVKDGNEDIEGSPITLNRSDFEGRDVWKWEIDEPEDADEDTEYVVSEEWPEDYTNKDHYTVEIDDCDITNTWHSEIPETVTVQGKKIWKDGGDRDGLRPETIKVYLLAGGSRVKDDDGNDIYAETSEAGEWKYFFPNLPRTDETGNTIEYSVEEESVENYESETDGYNIINTHKPETVDIEVTKVWDDSNDQDGMRPDSIIVYLKADGRVVASKTIDEEDGWSWTFEDQYVKADGEEIKYTVIEKPVRGYETEIDGFNITNKHDPDKISINVQKVWEDDEDRDGIRPDSVTVKLLANGADTGKTLELTDDKLTGSFESVDANKDGEKINYTVEEVTTSTVTGTDGPGTYAFEVTGSAEEGFTVTNTHTPERVSVEGTKEWDDEDNADEIRPESITVYLKADGKVADSKTVGEAENWSWAFENLYKNDDGEEIEYSVTEKPVSGYEAEVDGYNVKNTHIPSTVRVEGTKTWDDDDDANGKRPESIVIRLKADGVEVAEKTVTAGDGWTWAFENLPEKKDGKDITYTVTEDTVEDYTSSVDGYNITNTYTPDKTQVTVTKVWEDSDDQDGVRPASVSVVLLADGNETDNTLVLSERTGWTGSFTDLDVLNSDGDKIVYSVKETEPAGADAGEDVQRVYSGSVSGDAVKGFTITNTHVPETIDIEGTKTWDDGDDQDGIRPDEITIYLLIGDTVIDSKTVTAEDEWKWSFEDVDRYKDGEEIAYSISEKPVEGYETEVTGFNVKNTHVPETVTIEGTKTWEHLSNSPELSPDSITVRLKADGSEVAAKTVTANDGWSWTFEDLPKYKAGEEIVYTITEDTVPDYTPSVDGFNITNTYTPGKTQVTVTKVWDDGNDKDGIRPQEVTIKLFADGTDTGKTLVLSADTGWMGSFADLNIRKGEREIVYTVEEVLTDVITGTDGHGTYSVSVAGDASKGFTVTNTHTPAVMYTITYKLNGGIFAGSKEDIVETYPDGTVISIHTAPTRDGYVFLYWKGSEYQPGDEYKVTGDHVFTAQWKETESGPSTGDTSSLLLWIAAMAFSLFGTIAAYISSKKRKHKR